MLSISSSLIFIDFLRPIFSCLCLMYAEKKNNKAKNAPSRKLIKRNKGIGAVYVTKYKLRFIFSALNIEIIIENAISESVIRNISTLNILVTYYSISIVN